MNDVGVEASALSQFSWPGLPSMGSGQMGSGFSLLPAGLASALSSPNSFIQALESANTAIANGISSGAANTYAVLLPTADSANALVTSIPSHNVNLFLNGVEQVVNGDLLVGWSMHPALRLLLTSRWACSEVGSNSKSSWMQPDSIFRSQHKLGQPCAESVGSGQCRPY